MQPLMIESLGHTATRSISKILSSLNDSYVQHGRRNFNSKLSPHNKNYVSQNSNEYLTSMIEKTSEFKIVVSIHSNWIASDMKKVCDSKSINFKYLIRNPLNQINSCYSKYINEIFETNSPEILKLFPLVENKMQSLNIPTTLPNFLYFHSFFYIIRNNIYNILSGVECTKVEDLLRSKKNFVEILGLPNTLLNQNIDYFDKKPFRINQHSQKAKKIRLPEPDRDKILQNTAVLFNGQSYDFDDYLSLSGYKKTL